MDADAADVVGKLEDPMFNPSKLLGKDKVRVSLHSALRTMIPYLPLTILEDRNVVQYVEVTLHMAKVLGEDDPQDPREFYQNGATVLDRMPAGEKFADIFANTKWGPDSEYLGSSSLLDGYKVPTNTSDMDPYRPPKDAPRRGPKIGMTI